jgi:hypothetical protein
LPYTVRRAEDRRAVKPDEKEAQRQRGDRYSAIGGPSGRAGSQDHDCLGEALRTAVDGPGLLD